MKLFFRLQLSDQTIRGAACSSTGFEHLRKPYYITLYKKHTSITTGIVLVNPTLTWSGRVSNTVGCRMVSVGYCRLDPTEFGKICARTHKQPFFHMHVHVHVERLHDPCWSATTALHRDTTNRQSKTHREAHGSQSKGQPSTIWHDCIRDGEHFPQSPETSERRDDQGIHRTTMKTRS